MYEPLLKKQKINSQRITNISQHTRYFFTNVFVF